MTTAMFWSGLAVWLAVLTVQAQVPDNEEKDGQSSRKILGSSVVTSVSVVMETGNGKHTYYSDAVGHPLSKPHIASQVASPINLLNPDRYEFYTFNDDGELVKRLMTLEEIQGIIAGGDGEASNYNSEYHSQDSNSGNEVSGIVENVQNVLKEEIEAHKNLPELKPTLENSDIPSTWNMILPAFFGDTIVSEPVTVRESMITAWKPPEENNQLDSSTEFISMSSRTTGSEGNDLDVTKMSSNDQMGTTNAQSSVPEGLKSTTESRVENIEGSSENPNRYGSSSTNFLPMSTKDNDATNDVTNGVFNGASTIFLSEPTTDKASGSDDSSEGTSTIFYPGHTKDSATGSASTIFYPGFTKSPASDGTSIILYPEFTKGSTASQGASTNFLLGPTTDKTSANYVAGPGAFITFQSVFTEGKTASTNFASTTENVANIEENSGSKGASTMFESTEKNVSPVKAAENLNNMAEGNKVSTTNEMVEMTSRPILQTMGHPTSTEEKLHEKSTESVPSTMAETSDTVIYLPLERVSIKQPPITEIVNMKPSTVQITINNETKLTTPTNDQTKITELVSMITKPTMRTTSVTFPQTIAHSALTLSSTTKPFVEEKIETPPAVVDNNVSVLNIDSVNNHIKLNTGTLLSTETPNSAQQTNEHPSELLQHLQNENLNENHPVKVIENFLNTSQNLSSILSETATLASSLVGTDIEESKLPEENIEDQDTKVIEGALNSSMNMSEFLGQSVTLASTLLEGNFLQLTTESNVNMATTYSEDLEQRPEETTDTFASSETSTEKVSSQKETTDSPVKLTPTEENIFLSTKAEISSSAKVETSSTEEIKPRPGSATTSTNQAPKSTTKLPIESIKVNTATFNNQNLFSNAPEVNKEETKLPGPFKPTTKFPVTSKLPTTLSPPSETPVAFTTTKPSTMKSTSEQSVTFNSTPELLTAFKLTTRLPSTFKSTTRLPATIKSTIKLPTTIKSTTVQPEFDAKQNLTISRFNISGYINLKDNFSIRPEDNKEVTSAILAANNMQKRTTTERNLTPLMVTKDNISQQEQESNSTTKNVTTEMIKNSSETTQSNFPTSSIKSTEKIPTEANKSSSSKRPIGLTNSSTTLKMPQILNETNQTLTTVASKKTEDLPSIATTSAKPLMTTKENVVGKVNASEPYRRTEDKAPDPEDSWRPVQMVKPSRVSSTKRPDLTTSTVMKDSTEKMSTGSYPSVTKISSGPQVTLGEPSKSTTNFGSRPEGTFGRPSLETMMSTDGNSQQTFERPSGSYQPTTVVNSNLQGITTRPSESVQSTTDFKTKPHGTFVQRPEEINTSGSFVKPLDKIQTSINLASQGITGRPTEEPTSPPASIDFNSSMPTTNIHLKPQGLLGQSSLKPVQTTSNPQGAEKPSLGEKPMQQPSLIGKPLEAYQPPTKVDLNSQGSFGFPPLSEDMSMFSKTYNELALKFWNSLQLKDINSERSAAVSPFGIISVLAMIFLGARGGTSGEMNDVLKLDDIVTFNPHLVFKEVTESSISRKTSSAVVRELYTDINKGKVLDFYKARVKQFYDGHVEEVDFKKINNVIRRRTNSLINKQTQGKMPQYLEDTTLTLRAPMSALSTNVFQADCSDASTGGRDGELYFIVLPSIRQRRLVPIPAAVWRSNFIAGYAPELDATAVSLGNLHQAISTVFVMPGQQGHSAPGDVLLRLEARLLGSTYAPEIWTQLFKSLLPRPGLEIQLPRFSHKSVINATDSLKRMGLREMFSKKKADLRGLNGNAHGLYFSDLIQVNEFSICGETQQMHMETYPSATEYLENREEMRRFKYVDYFEEAEYDKYSSIPLSLRPRQARVPEVPRLRFDRPFLYFVRHNPTGFILHMGRFNPRLLT